MAADQGFGGRPIGASVQAPIRGLQRAFNGASQAAPSSTVPGGDGEDGVDRSGLGTRLPQEPFTALIDLVRRNGKVY